ncbi:MAG: carbamoyltransferase HypF [Dysgonamonadaceae bacterium]|jgi:hydrogenase maturation protein HypF|nr:carbamoyltransferase HypF [Dysgonamonadaceae bacterium]
MTYKITVRGLVQGVGFRPFIYLLAKDMGLRGTVSNSNNGVEIVVELIGLEKDIFIGRIKKEHPQAAEIHSIEIEETEETELDYGDFSIVRSASRSDEITQVAPDIAVCDDCLADRRLQTHRKNYPFINCTHCGPRFSIIRDLPYDRCRTTMADFRMCAACEKEFTDPADRRFHAQPVACNSCGPQYYIDNEENTYEEVLAKSVSAINAGKVVAIRGIGGYHLVCDAANDKAVRQLRKIKDRDTKPFAVMFANLEAMQDYVLVNEEETRNISNWRRPIVLLKTRENPAYSCSEQVNPGMKTLGCMLPYMPIHYDWFEHLQTPVIVMTSGNLNDRPIIISPEEARNELGGRADLLIHHNRPVHNRVDDSVVQVCGGQACIVRRSRGYVPEPLFTEVETEGILAFGAEKVNTFALGKGSTIIQSQYIGDLKNEETFAFYAEAMQRFCNLFRFKPRMLVCDLHPDYLSSLHAEKIAKENGLQLIRVQHHYAHAAACMLEYGLREPVLAVIWDGIGLGDDGAAWGGEFFLCDGRNYRRLAHPDYVTMPGGDRASLEPWRMAAAWLKHYDIPLPQRFTERIGKEKIAQINSMLEKNINCPLTSSIGRLFDAAASLSGVCDFTSRQAEAAILLEQIANLDCRSSYSIDSESNPISFRPLFEEIIEDLQQNVPASRISAKFHNMLIDLILSKTLQFSKQYGINKIVISGGCFQNKFLVEGLQKRFAETPLTLFVPSRIPCNDSGIAAGQLFIAANKKLISTQ